MQHTARFMCAKCAVKTKPICFILLRLPFFKNLTMLSSFYHPPFPFHNFQSKYEMTNSELYGQRQL